MESKGILLLFVCIVIGLYLKLNWLVILLVLFLFFVALGSLGTEKKKVSIPKAEEEIIYPVIYEDVGEAPYLYHPATKIHVKPNWENPTKWEEGVIGIGSAFKAVRNFIVGSKKE